MSERRNAFRVPCDFEIEVQAPGARYLARAIDAGPQGLRLRIRGPWVAKILKRGQPLKLRFVTPLYEAEIDTVAGAILWVKREGEQLFTMAVSFQEEIDTLKKSWVKPVLQRVFKNTSRKNARRYLRARCLLPGSIEWAGKRFDVKITDLSTSGARVGSLQSIPQGEPLQIAFQEMRLPAVVRRSQEELGICRLGLHFLIDTEQRKKLIRLVKQLTEVGKIIPPGS